MTALNWAGSGSFGNVGVLNCFTSVQYLCSEVVSADERVPPPWHPAPTRPARTAATPRVIPRIRTTSPRYRLSRARSGQPDPVGPGLAHRAFGRTPAGVVPSSDDGMAYEPGVRGVPGMKTGNSPLPDENRASAEVFIARPRVVVSVYCL